LARIKEKVCPVTKKPGVATGFVRTPYCLKRGKKKATKKKNAEEGKKKLSDNW